jgi:hypothetical protein
VRKFTFGVKKNIRKPSEEVYICMFCGHVGHLDEFCFRHKRMEKRRVNYAGNSYHNEFIDFPPYISSRAPSHFIMDLTIAYMALVHKRVTLCLDALVSTHVLIKVFIPVWAWFFR